MEGLLEASDGKDWKYHNGASSGISVETLATNINGYLAAYPTLLGDPQFVLINIGVNNAAGVSGSMDETTVKNAFLAVLDAIHTKWSDVPVYAMRVWGRNADANCDLIDGWIDEVVALRAWAHLGPDERVFLENGDNGVTYTADGVHPNAAGYALTAAQWKTAMGY